MEGFTSPSTVKQNQTNETFVILCASGFENVARAKSALMFAALAAAAEYHSVLYCIQNGVEIMVRGAIADFEKTDPSSPTLSQRLKEAIEEGVEILCCSQTLKNKGLTEKDLIAEASASGAMTLIDLTTEAKGVLCF